MAVLLALAPRLGVPESLPVAMEPAKRPPAVTRFTVEASGDLLIHSPVFQRAATLAGGLGYDFAPLFREIRPYVAGADLALCHIETPMTSAPPTGYPIFNTPPALAAGVAATGWDACDTASNHSLDQGQSGIDQTGAALDRAGVAHVGSFPSAAARRRPVLLKVAGVKLGYLAYTTSTNGIPRPNRWSLNIAEPGHVARVLADVRRDRRAGADGVIVNLHWGPIDAPEYVSSVTDRQLGLARVVATTPGVVAVVGQGPHVVQPIRWIAGRPVVFSEGNLISNQGTDSGLAAASQDGLIALIDFVARGHAVRARRVSYVPTWVRHSDYEVLPVGPALARGQDEPAALRASYARTVGVAGRGPRVQPIPPKLPGG